MLRPYLLLLPLILLAAGCDLPGKPDLEERPKFPDQVSDFNRLFAVNCVGCHGQMEGKTPKGEGGPAPPLNDPLFRAGISEKELTTVLTSGRKDTQMPGFLKKNGGLLTAEQIQLLVHEIKGTSYKVTELGVPERVQLVVIEDDNGRKPVWGKPARLPDDSPPYQAPAGEVGDKDHGLKLFAVACASCHGEDGKGVKSPKKSDLINTINDKAFLALVSDQFLRRIIITGRSDLGMPDYAKKTGRGSAFKPLSSRDVADLVALLGSWRQSKSSNEK